MKKDHEEEKAVWSRANHDIYENFALDLQEFWKDGKRPAAASHMLTVSLEKQQEQMKKKGLSMTYEMEPCGHFADKSITRGWKDNVFTNTIAVRSCHLTRKIFRGGKQIYKEKEQVNLYETITTLNYGRTSAKTLRACPSCGALNTIEQLQDQCRYCQTKFKMSELFPKVTGFFTCRDFGGTEREVKKSLSRVCVPVGVLTFLFLLIRNLFFDGPDKTLILALLGSLIGGVISGAAIGYLIWAILMLGGVFREAAKAVPLMFAVTGSRKRFVETVRKHSPEFNYDYFVDKTASILRQLLSEERIEENPYYAGPPADLAAENIVEYSLTAAALKKCRMDGTVCSAKMDVYMKDYYDTGSGIRRKDEKFRMILKKDLAKQINYHFSLEAIRCESCGASFDAGRNRNCPHCGKPYEIGEDDWIVTEIRRI